MYTIEIKHCLPNITLFKNFFFPNVTLKAAKNFLKVVGKVWVAMFLSIAYMMLYEN